MVLTHYVVLSYATVPAGRGPSNSQRNTTGAGRSAMLIGSGGSLSASNDLAGQTVLFEEHDPVIQIPRRR